MPEDEWVGSDQGFLFDVPTWFMVAAGLMAVFIAFFFLMLAYRGMQACQLKRRNDASPVESLPATVVNKREKTVGGGETMARTLYFVTFQTADGGRREFEVKDAVSGLLAIGDAGNLTHQGTRFTDFQLTGDARSITGQ